MRRTLKASFECKTANREHTCIYCGNTIHKGTKYYSKTENSERLGKRLEEETGFPIREIKRRTHFWFVNTLNLKFCSLKCLQDYSQHPEQTYQRKIEIEEGILNRVKEVIQLMSALEGKTK